jgi:hydrogenase maturation protease
VRTLLLGMGNPILCDDAVGVRLAADLGQRLGPRPGVDVVPECSVGGLNILEVLGGYDRVIVLDAVCVVDPTPGRWHRFDSTALRETLHLGSVHDANFATALELGRRLGVALPPAEEIHVFAVEVTDPLTFSEEMTPALERAYTQFSAEIYDELVELVGQGAPTTV